MTLRIWTAGASSAVTATRIASTVIPWFLSARAAPGNVVEIVAP